MPVIATPWNTIVSTSAAPTTRTSTSAPLPADVYLSVTMALTTGLGAGTVTVTDSAGGAWTQIESNQTQVNVRTFWRTTRSTGHSTFTITVTTATGSIMYLVGTYFTGASGARSALTTGTAIGSFPNVTTAAATQADDLYFQQVRYQPSPNALATFTPASGWTVGGTANAASGSRVTSVARRLATSATTTTTGVGTSSGAVGDMSISTFVVYASQKVFTGWGIPLV